MSANASETSTQSFPLAGTHDEFAFGIAYRAEIIVGEVAVDIAFTNHRNESCESLAIDKAIASFG